MRLCIGRLLRLGHDAASLGKRFSIFGENVVVSKSRQPTTLRRNVISRQNRNHKCPAYSIFSIPHPVGLYVYQFEA